MTQATPDGASAPAKDYNKPIDSLSAGTPPTYNSAATTTNLADPSLGDLQINPRTPHPWRIRQLTTVIHNKQQESENPFRL